MKKRRTEDENGISLCYGMNPNPKKICDSSHNGYCMQPIYYCGLDCDSISTCRIYKYKSTHPDWKREFAKILGIELLIDGKWQIPR